METSDSDYFESADEDIPSDNEDTATVKSTSPSPVQELTTHLNHMQIEKKQQGDVGETEARPPSPEAQSPKADIQPVKLETKVKKTPASENISVALSAESPQQFPPKSVEKHSKSAPALVSPARSDAQTQSFEIRTGTRPSNDSMNVNIAPSDESLWDDSELDWGAEDSKDKEDKWNSESDGWETVENTKPETVTSSWGSWGNWGVSSLISTGVSSITHAISTAMDVPNPEELARRDRDEILTETEEKPEKPNFVLGNFVMGVSHLTKLVEETGTKVITGGLDTLETIGKKTMEVLQEGDPGLKKKRAFLKIEQDKPVLSQLLREAKEKAEQENRILEEKHFAKKAKNYETLFDDHQGLVHLEALEMLSKQCDLKLQTLQESYSESQLIEMQETMEQVKELCELPDEEEDEHLKLEDIKDKLRQAVTDLNVGISYGKLIETWEETQNWLDSLKLDVCDERELHQQSIETLAQLTAIAVEQFHKTAELLLVKEHRSTADEADSLVQLTTTLTALIGLVAGKFSDKLNNKENVNKLITNVFFEAANSSSYIQDAFQLLIPVIQAGAV